MKYLYYLVAIAPILWKFSFIFNLDNMHAALMRFKNVRGKSLKAYSDNQKTVSFLLLLYLLWIFIGLFTFNWVSFLVLIFLGFVPNNNKYVVFINSVISVLILFFVVLNAFHFHIDVWNLIYSAALKY